MTLIELPPEVWAKLPGDRPFTALTADAVASERRIRKGVNLGRERSRYTQLCNWIELSALQLLHDGKISKSLVLCDSVQGSVASDYLRLIEFLQIQPDVFGWVNRPIAPQTISAAEKRSLLQKILAWLGLIARSAKQTVNPEAKVKGRSPRPLPIGKSFYMPGDAVVEQSELFARVTLERLESVAAEIGSDKLRPYAQIAVQKANFYREAHGRKSGVVEVLAMNAE